MPSHECESVLSLFKKKKRRKEDKISRKESFYVVFLSALKAVCHVSRHTQHLMWSTKRFWLLMDYLPIVLQCNCLFLLHLSFLLFSIFFFCHLCLSDMSSTMNIEKGGHAAKNKRCRWYVWPHYIVNHWLTEFNNPYICQHVLFLFVRFLITVVAKYSDHSWNVLKLVGHWSASSDMTSDWQITLN